MKNPPAFPVNYNEDGQLDGMSLRDYFAAKAMQALAGNTDAMKALAAANKDSNEMRKNISRLSYSMANSMLEERAKE